MLFWELSFFVCIHVHTGGWTRVKLTQNDPEIDRKKNTMKPTIFPLNLIDVLFFILSSKIWCRNKYKKLFCNINFKLWYLFLVIIVYIKNFITSCYKHSLELLIQYKLWFLKVHSIFMTQPYSIKPCHNLWKDAY